jgi:hypothetical protein
VRVFDSTELRHYLQGDYQTTRLPIDRQNVFGVFSFHLSRGDKSSLLHVAPRSTWSASNCSASRQQREALSSTGTVVRVAPTGDIPRRPEATRGNIAHDQRLPLWSRRSASRVNRHREPGDSIGKASSSEFLVTRSRPERPRQRLDAHAHIRRRIDDLYRTLIGALQQAPLSSGPHRTRARGQAPR